jgi:two-component system LytT family response regulator
MPEIGGFDVLDVLGDEVPGVLPVVVFVTAYDQYAPRGFDARASDHLLKPYTVTNGSRWRYSGQ